MTQLSQATIHAVLQEMGRRGAAARKPKERVCPVCGRSFVTTGRGLYHSPSCRTTAYRRRRRDAELLTSSTVEPS